MILLETRLATPQAGVSPLDWIQGAVAAGRDAIPAAYEKSGLRKSDFVHHHHHPDGVVYRSFCLNSSAFAVSEIASRRRWCIESLFPGLSYSAAKEDLRPGDHVYAWKLGFLYSHHGIVVIRGNHSSNECFLHKW